MWCGVWVVVAGCLDICFQQQQLNTSFPSQQYLSQKNGNISRFQNAAKIFVIGISFPRVLLVVPHGGHAGDGLAAQVDHSLQHRLLVLGREGGWRRWHHCN